MSAINFWYKKIITPQDILKNDEIHAKTAALAPLWGHRSEPYNCTENEEAQGLNVKFAFCRYP